MNNVLQIKYQQKNNFWFFAKAIITGINFEMGNFNGLELKPISEISHFYLVLP